MTAISPADAPVPPASRLARWRNCPLDIWILAGLAASLWTTTLAWRAGDGNAWLTAPLKSGSTDANLWVLAMSGALYGYLLIAWIVAVWGYIVGIPTVLLAANLALVRLKPHYRWPIALALAMGLFFATPVAALFGGGEGVEDRDTRNHAASERADASRSPPPTADERRKAAATCAHPPDILTADRCMALGFPRPNDAELERIVKTMCATSKDPDTVHRCALQYEADDWQADTARDRQAPARPR